MTEPVEKTYYMRVYEKCTHCDDEGYLTVFPRREIVCTWCEGEGYVNVYIPLAEWAAQMRERVGVGPGTPGAYTVTFTPDNVTYAPDSFSPGASVTIA